MSAPIDLDLVTLPSGKSYSDTYAAWLALWQKIAESESVTLRNVPRSWVPLALYLGAVVESHRAEFAEDEVVAFPRSMYRRAAETGRQREYAEMVCGIRPELADAMWKSDVEWNTNNRDHVSQQRFAVANYSAMYRPEIRAYFHSLRQYRLPPGVHNCVVVPCYADKPYPSPIHRAVEQVLPDASWHQVCATGALGVIPQELWPIMPLYDSGIPNFHRCRLAWKEYLARNQYERIVVFCDFYASVLQSVLADSPSIVTHVLPALARTDYLDLAQPQYLNRLAAALAESGSPVMQKAWVF